ncbi:MAG TPA: dUTP diphosphatase [Campylobacterales bacterium]|nr:dUTP diphosphatase [Campylobacterales bacterium]HIO71464.1 dUTP diphosphatase [Campylobacterales bacterium]
MEIRIKKLYPDVEIPKYQTSGAVGFDLRAVENVSIPSGETRLVGTGLAVELPHGYELQIRPRSGLALKHSITVLNSPGTVDSDYRGEIKVLLINHGKSDFQISKGDRIAQAVVNRVEIVDIVEVEELSETQRGDKGFGSTGRK